MTPLRQVRQWRGWSQPRLIHALRRAAADDGGTTLPSDASLKALVSRWENGHQLPDAFYQRLLCIALRVTPEQLGFPSGPLFAAQGDVPTPEPGQATIDYLRGCFAEHARADNLLGPALLLPVVRAQAATVDEAVRVVPGARRRDVLELACRFSELIGWLLQDAGDPATADTYTARAYNYAAELPDPNLHAYMLMRRSNIATDAGDHQRALDTAAAALAVPGRLHPRVRAVILRQQANALASIGDRSGCNRAIDAALADADGAHPGDDTILAGYCTTAYVQMEAATCWTRLGHPERAVDVYRSGLDAWPQQLRRDRGLCLARLAVAQASMDDVTAAIGTGREALTAAALAPSARTGRELRRLRARLLPHRGTHEAGSDLDELLALLHR